MKREDIDTITGTRDLHETDSRAMRDICTQDKIGH